jgi:hypothetical protein
MESGDASPMVIFEKVALGRFSFLIAILFNIRFLKDSYHKCIYKAVYSRNSYSFFVTYFVENQYFKSG